MCICWCNNKYQLTKMNGINIKIKVNKNNKSPFRYYLIFMIILTFVSTESQFLLWPLSILRLTEE